jgi:hypothetical protein
LPPPTAKNAGPVKPALHHNAECTSISGRAFDHEGRKGHEPPVTNAANVAGAERAGLVRDSEKPCSSSTVRRIRRSGSAVTAFAVFETRRA